jgi:hypothetical protein
MLVSLYLGQERSSSLYKGDFHFDSLPTQGDQVEFEGRFLTVTKAWHTPAPHYLGPKYAVLTWDGTGDGG